MLDAASAILFIREKKFIDIHIDIHRDRMLRSAVERNLEIIGEAARRVLIETRSVLSDILWTSVVGVRNVIAQEYGEIRYEKLWSICVNRLPQLVESLKKTGVSDLPDVTKPNRQFD